MSPLPRIVTKWELLCIIWDDKRLLLSTRPTNVQYKDRNPSSPYRRIYSSFTDTVHMEHKTSLILSFIKSKKRKEEEGRTTKHPQTYNFSLYSVCVYKIIYALTIGQRELTYPNFSQDHVTSALALNHMISSRDSRDFCKYFFSLFEYTETRLIEKGNLTGAKSNVRKRKPVPMCEATGLL